MTLALYQTNQIKALESRVFSEKWDTPFGLMSKAGRAAFEVIQSSWPWAQRLVVCCGKGNNAGDGYIVANLAKSAGKSVIVLQLSPISDLNGPALEAAQAAEAAGVEMKAFSPESGDLRAADLLVDALLGTGLKGEVQAPYDAAIEAMNATGLPTLALDIPSGLDADTGQIQGCAVQATATMTFMGIKPGLVTNKGPAYAGEIYSDALNVPATFFDTQEPKATLLAWEDIQRVLPIRQRDAQKGDYGHVLVIGGDYGMGGAVRMAAEAAMRVGSGLVSVATRPEHVPVVSCSRPEIMCHQVATGEDLLPLLKRATVVVIGPGLGQSDWAKDLLACVRETDLPLVVDADGLNLLSQTPAQCDRWVLTPHPGEASRLLGVNTQDIQDDRFAAVAEIQKKYGGTVVLKGVGTLIRGAQGVTRVCPAGNPGMATGGMGDILSGVIGGLIAQHLSLTCAAEVGVLVHALAADRAAAQGGERGLLACDLMQHLRELVNPNE